MTRPAGLLRQYPETSSSEGGYRTLQPDARDRRVVVSRLPTHGPHRFTDRRKRKGCVGRRKGGRVGLVHPSAHPFRTPESIRERLGPLIQDIKLDSQPQPPHLLSHTNLLCCADNYPHINQTQTTTTTMPIISRHSEVAEYATLISTSSSSRARRRTTPAAAVYDAVSLPVSDIQGAVRRFQSDSDISQTGIFAFLFPLYGFTVLFAFAVVAFQPKSFAHHVLSDPRGHPSEIVLGAVLLAAVIILGGAVLRAVVWVVAKIVSGFVEDMDVATHKAFPQPGSDEPLSATALLRGIFM